MSRIDPTNTNPIQTPSLDSDFKTNGQTPTSEIQQTKAPSIPIIPSETKPSTDGSDATLKLHSQDNPTKSVSAAIQSINKTDTTTDTKTSATNSTAEKPISESTETAHIATPEDVEKLNDMLGNKQEPNKHIADKTHIKQTEDMFGGSDSVNAAGKSTITKSTTSGHPHLDETTNAAVKNCFKPDTKEVEKGNVDGLLTILKEQKLTDKDLNIDFKAFGLDSQTIRKAGIKGKFIKNTDGSFDFKITGKCSQEAVQCMAKLKEKLNKINEENGFKVPINIHPETVGPLSNEDKITLERGGQIQYRPVNNENIMKLTLDPGSHGQNDGLMIGVFSVSNDNSLIKTSLSPKIPLKVVFEGGELNGQKVGPFLPNWRAEKLFENSIIHSERELFFGKRKTNEDDVGRIQTQNKLWNAVNEYLKASATITEGHFETSNNISEQPEVEQEVDRHKTEADVKKATINTNQDAIIELSLQSIPANFDSSIEKPSLNNATNIGESTMENLLVGKNTSVDLKAKTSLDQTKGDIASQSQNQELQESLQVATHEETIVTETGKIYSDQLTKLRQKAIENILTPKDIKNFQRNLPGPAQIYLNNFLKANNIHYMQMQDLNRRFAILDDKTCEKIGQAIAQASIPQNTQTIEANPNNEITGDPEIDKNLTDLQNAINNLLENEINNDDKLNFEHIKLIIKATSKDPQKKKNTLNAFKRTHEELSKQINKIAKDLLDLVGVDETLAAWDGEIDKIKQDFNESLFEDFNKNYTTFKEAIKTLSQSLPKAQNPLNDLLMTVYNNTISVLCNLDLRKQSSVDNILETVNKSLQETLTDLNSATEFYPPKSNIPLTRFEEAGNLTKQILGNEIRQALANASINYPSNTDTQIFEEFLNFKNTNPNYETYTTLLNAFIEHEKTKNSQALHGTE